MVRFVGFYLPITFQLSTDYLTANFRCFTKIALFIRLYAYTL
nr:MAG TPA: hypothetical protein [Caudoviricetes sp.]DAX09467.1 MAG TPA: hypothetical protein [Bacteriophage sp.]DAY72278.1 MAG TPA: hypothetical protein [Caudoviricetes sp.]